MNNRPTISMTPAMFYNSWFKNCDRFIKESERPTDKIVDLESSLTLAEIDIVMKPCININLPFTVSSLAPFKAFLQQRWNRINGTAASYTTSSAITGNYVCNKFAKGIILIEAGTQMEEGVNIEEINDEMIKPLLMPTPPSPRNDPEIALKVAVLSKVSIAFGKQSELVNFLATKVQCQDWCDFLNYCDPDGLIKLFFGGNFEQNFEAVMTSKNLFTGNMHYNKALLMCLTECYKRDRMAKNTPYLRPGIFLPQTTGYLGNSKIREAERLQSFLSDELRPLGSLKHCLADKKTGHLHGALKNGKLKFIKNKIDELGKEELKKSPSGFCNSRN